MVDVVLFSTSPRRRRILESAGFSVRVVSPLSEPEREVCEEPKDFVLRSAEAKMDFSLELGKDEVATSADTVVVLDGRVLGKPQNEGEALEYLLALSGRVHEVFTGVVFRDAHRVERRVVSTLVKFLPIGPEEARAYVSTGEPMDKAGAYGIQGVGSMLVEWVVGDFYNVMGYPVVELYKFLRESGINPMRGGKGYDF